MEQKEREVMQGLNECMEDCMPNYLYVKAFGTDGQTQVTEIDEIAKASICFLRLDNHGYSLMYNDFYDIDPACIGLLKEQLHSLVPQPYYLDDGYGWMISIDESSWNTRKRNVKASFRNLMFWESLIDSNQTGPLLTCLGERQKLIRMYEEHTDNARNYLLSNRYLKDDGRGATEDMRSMIVALTNVIDTYKQQESKTEEVFNDTVRSRFDTAYNLMLALNQTQQTTQSIQEKLAKQLEELQEIINSEGK